MLLSVYKYALALSTPLLEVYLSRREKRGKEDPTRKHERRGKPTRARGDAPLVWFHGASVGEALALLSLVEKTLENFPSAQVMVTTGTVTSAKLMADRLPARAFHQYIPVDHPAWVNGFLNHWKPDAVIWSESELWPNLLSGIKKRAIPAILLNARLSDKTCRHWSYAPKTIKKILSSFQFCLAQNKTIADRLTKLGAKNVSISGNLKYAAQPLPFHADKLNELKAAVGDRPFVLWASTHKGDEELALRYHTHWQKKYANLLTLVLPRHPARGAEIAALLNSAPQRSAGTLPAGHHGFYVADTLGETGLFYKLSPLCIMGGSFVPTGGHNPIEPAHFGCHLFYGPYMFNFITICDDFESRDAVVKCHDISDLMLKLDPCGSYVHGQKAHTWVTSQLTVVDDIMKDIKPFLAKAGVA